MRKLVILLISMSLFLSVCGCVTQVREDGNPWDDDFHKYYDADLDEVAVDFESINKWVYFNISYMSDMSKWGMPEYWQPPHVTLEDRTGDCEDHAILFMYLVYYYFDVKCPMLVLEVYEGGFHAISEYGEYYYDPTSCPDPYEKATAEWWDIVDSIPYDMAMARANGYMILSDLPYVID